MEPTKSLTDFLLWLASSGGAGIMLAFILERIPAFQTLASEAKSWVTLAGTIALALAAFAILTYVPVNVLTTIAPFFAVVAGVVTTWLASQGAHAVDPARIVTPTVKPPEPPQV